MAANNEIPVGWENLSDADLIHQAAVQAGEIALQYFQAENTVWYKAGNSPVSQADHAVDLFLKNTFRHYRPDYGWLSEESEDDPSRLAAKRVMIVDPIDGTRGFIDGRDEWCVSIAIVEGARPVEAVLACPALGQTFQAQAGSGAQLNTAATHIRAPGASLEVTGSKRINAALQDNKPAHMEIIDFVPSLAYRIAMVASGKLDAAFARSGAQEWDLAAADLILEEAGGKLTDMDARPVSYNQSKTRAPALVAAPASQHGEMLDLAGTLGILQ